MQPNKVIRGLWFIPYFFTNTAIMGMLSIIVSLWSAKGARWFAPQWAKMNVKAARVKLDVRGLKNIPDPSEGGVIIASNHVSAADIGAVLAGLPVDVCWVTKASLLKVPFLGWHLKRVHIPVARRNAGNTGRFLEDGAQKIRDGAAVVIFPEGTRNPGPGKLLPFKKGAFLLAHASGRPIIPVAIIGSSKVWPVKDKLPGSGTVTMLVGKPIDPQPYSDYELDKLAETTRNAILELLED